MDYDDNDISRHSLQLASEGRSRSSSGLKPYEFPKFDFDENLQGHLRFDSLVENEVFLGIPSQEDNQWIEDYSQVSNGMEFNSTPADPCSNTRRDNVWSEATSSESVEMLLKSVGQEEMMPAASIILATSVCKDQVGSEGHIESGIDLDTRNSDTMGPKDEVHEDPAPNKPLDEQLSLVEASSLSSENAGLSFENPHNVTHNTLSARSDISAIVGEHEPADKNVQEPKTIGCSTMVMLGASEALLQKNADVSQIICNERGHESHASTRTGIEETVVLDGNTRKSSVDISSMGDTACLESRVENSVDTVAANLDCPKPKDSASIPSNKECELLFPDGDEKTSPRPSLQTGDLEISTLATSSNIRRTLDGIQEGSIDGSNQHSSEPGYLVEHCTVPDGKGDSFIQLIPRPDNSEGVQTSQSPSGTLCATPLLTTVETNKDSTERADRISNTDISKSSKPDLLSSDAGNHQITKVEGCVNDSALTQQGLGVHLAGDVCVSSQAIEKTLPHAQAEVAAPRDVICVSSENDGKRPVSLVNMDPVNVETLTTHLGTHLGTQSVGEEEVVKCYDGLCNLQGQTSDGTETETDELAPHAKSKVLVAVADQAKEEKLSAIEFPISDNISGQDGVTKNPDAHLISGAASVLDVNADGDSGLSPLSEVASSSRKFVRKCNEMSNKSPSPVPISIMDLDKQVNDMGCKKSNLIGSCDANIGSGSKHEIKPMKSEGDNELAQPAEVDKTSCGSPTIISSSEPSGMEANDLEDAKGSEITEHAIKGSQPASGDVKGKDLTGDDNSFTFKVNAMPDTTRESETSWSPFHDADKSNPTIVANESIPPSKGKTQRMHSPRTPRQSARPTDVESSQGNSKGTHERKGRRTSGKGATKETAKKGGQTKGSNQENSAGTNNNNFSSPLSAPGSSPYVQFGHMQSYGNAGERSKPSLPGILPTKSNLPDMNASPLNKSISTSTTPRQPFTDLQQVQLRAQIFVYGSLIQGTPPDEACMVSAFGPSDAGRITWDSVWRTSVERARTQKSSPSNTETPLPSQSGARASDSTVKHGSHPSKVLSTPVSKVSSKDTPAIMAGPMIPLSSPLWSISTPLRDNLPSSSMHKVVGFQHAVTPLHSFQTPPIGSFNGHSPWPSQTCFPSPWLASSQTTSLSPSVQFQPVTMTETVKLTPVRDNSSPLASGMKHMTSVTAVHSVAPSPVYGGASLLRDAKRIPPELHSSDSKPRKRKKIATADHSTPASASGSQIVPVDALHSSPAGVSALAPPQADATLGSSIADDSTVCSLDPSTPDTMKGVTSSEECLKNVLEAKNQAENASVLAANAVTHCEDLWGKLAKEKEAGLTPESESKLISAAAAIAAAASVAKAAAAAAKVAFSAALQAKLLADEASLSGKHGVVVSSSAKSSSDVHKIQNATPASILKSEKSSNEPNSILVAAKEAAKRRVEAASVASKQAENLDAIVKAAELAASAVSQAGKIVAMGEPLSLVDLIEAGPDGYWKLPQTQAELDDRSRDENKDKFKAFHLKEVDDVHTKAPGVVSVARGGSRKRSHFKMHQGERLKDSVDAGMSHSDGIMGSVDTEEQKTRSGKDGEEFSMVTSVRDSATGTSSMRNEHENLAGSDEIIMEGSHVEVLKYGSNLKSAWYSAKVLKLEVGKVYVLYNDLASEEESGHLCEWVHLDGEGEKAPVIRVAHPWNSLQYQGTRKRRRAASGDCAWGAGDKVDVWIDDCWREGIVTEKNEKDETTLKVHFPAQGETLTVRAWNLRASRSWIDGKWVECTSWKPHHSSDQSDTPREKRQKMGSPVNGKDGLYSEGKVAVLDPVESKTLPLSISERTFEMGKTTKEVSKGVARRPLRSGQQKEGSRVVFGVPKPTGKTQKFMEVSKHFPASKGDKRKEASDQVKFPKYVMPQSTGTQGWKVPSRNLAKEKRTVESRPKVPSTRKSNRTLPQRENSGSRSGDVDSGTCLGTDADDSVGHDVNSSVKMTDHGFSVTDEPAEAPLSSLISHTLSSSSKKAPLSYSRSGRPNRGKLAPSGGKLSKIEEERVYAADSGKFVDEASGPRRSNRRFQPTHRLLEGLQSSMVIPKMLSVSHDKGQRNPSRNVFTRGK